MVMTKTRSEAFPLRCNRESIAIIRYLAGVMVRDAYPTATLMNTVAPRDGMAVEPDLGARVPADDIGRRVQPEPLPDHGAGVEQRVQIGRAGPTSGSGNRCSARSSASDMPAASSSLRALFSTTRRLSSPSPRTNSPSADGDLSNYVPDFLVKTTDGSVWIVETKGREEIDLPQTMARLNRRVGRRAGALTASCTSIRPVSRHPDRRISWVCSSLFGTIRIEKGSRTDYHCIPHASIATRRSP